MWGGGGLYLLLDLFQGAFIREGVYYKYQILEGAFIRKGRLFDKIRYLTLAQKMHSCLN